MLDPEFTRDAMPLPMTTNPAERCQYPSKICRNRRTAKRNGELHRFCEEHRIKANKNQKRWIKNSKRKWPNDAVKDRKSAGSAVTSPASSRSSSTPHTPLDEQSHDPQPEPLSPENSTPSFTALLHPLSYWEPHAATSYDQFTKEFVQEWSWPAPAVGLVGRLEYNLYEHEIEPVMIQL